MNRLESKSTIPVLLILFCIAGCQTAAEDRIEYSEISARDEVFYIHDASSAVFKKSYLDFEVMTEEIAAKVGSTPVVVHDDAGQEISVQYYMDGVPVFMFIRVYPSPNELADLGLHMKEFAYWRDAVFQYNELERVIDDQVIATMAGDYYLMNFSGAFKTGDSDADTVYCLCVIPVERWYVVFHFTAARLYLPDGAVQSLIKYVELFDFSSMR